MEQGGGDMRPSKVWDRAAPLPDRDFAIPCYRLRPPYNVFQLRTSWVPIFMSFVSSSLSLNGRFIIISRLICWGNWTSSWCFRFNMRSNNLRSDHLDSYWARHRWPREGTDLSAVQLLQQNLWGQFITAVLSEGVGLLLSASWIMQEAVVCSTPWKRTAAFSGKKLREKS